jgi:hypothetical protein
VKKLILVLLVGLFSGCAVASHTITMPNGTQYTDKTYRLFQSVNVSYFSKDTGFSYGTDQTLSTNLVALQGLAQVAGSIYGQSQGIPVKTTTDTTVK